MHLLVSLHDVTPAHHARLATAEALFSDLGVTRVAYFVVPDFHAAHPVRGDAAFAEWCRRPRPFTVDWVLHGYYHLDDGHRSGSAATWAKRRALTGGEGEFLTLDACAQRERLRDGLATLRAVGLEADAFVPPAWLSNAHLPSALRDYGVTYTEDHWHVRNVRTNQRRFAPAISWATRTTFRRVGARIVCPALAVACAPVQAVRLAVHPHDLDHRLTREQVRRVLQRLLRRRTSVGYRELFD